MENGRPVKRLRHHSGRSSGVVRPADSSAILQVHSQQSRGNSEEVFDIFSVFVHQFPPFYSFFFSFFQFLSFLGYENAFSMVFCFKILNYIIRAFFKGVK